MSQYPEVKAPDLVGTYPAVVAGGGGYVWDEVLEYRVWCHPEKGAPDLDEGSDYYHVYETYEEALKFSAATAGAEEPLALILQTEYIDEPEPNQFVHMREERMTEWPVVFLNRPRRTEATISDFFAPDAPSNRVDKLRGLA